MSEQPSTSQHDSQTAKPTASKEQLKVSYNMDWTHNILQI